MSRILISRTLATIFSAASRFFLSAAISQRNSRSKSIIGDTVRPTRSFRYGSDRPSPTVEVICLAISCKRLYSSVSPSTRRVIQMYWPKSALSSFSILRSSLFPPCSAFRAIQRPLSRRLGRAHIRAAAVAFADVYLCPWIFGLLGFPVAALAYISLVRRSAFTDRRDIFLAAHGAPPQNRHWRIFQLCVVRAA